MTQKRIVVNLSKADHSSIKAEAKRRKVTIREAVIEALRKAGYQIEDREE